MRTMFEEQNKVTEDAREQPEHHILNLSRIDFFIGSKLLEIWGKWHWEFNAEQLLCSDVMFTPNDGTLFSVTKVLIHPDDLHIIHKLIEKCNLKKSFDFSFRVITTYGEVTTINGQGLFECKEMEGFFDQLVRGSAEKYAEDKVNNEQCEHERLQLKAYQYAESAENSGIWFINSVTHESFFSNETFRIHGLSPQSLNSHLHTFSSFIHPDDREAVIAAIDNAYRHQVPLTLEYRLLLNKSEVKYIRNTTRWFYNSKGESVVAGAMKDITDRRIEEQQNSEIANELNLRSQQLKHAEAMVLMANWSLNVLTRKIEYSEQIYKIYGIRPNGGNAFGTNLLTKFVHPQDIEKVAEMNRQILYEHVAPETEYRIIRPDGKTKYLRQKGKLIIDANDEMIIIGTIIDITSLKSSDNSISKIRSDKDVLKSELEQSQEIANVCSWTWDIDTGEISFSRNVFDFLGYRTNASQLTQRAFLSFVHPDDKKLVTSNIEQILSGELSLNFAFRINRRSEVRHVDASFRLFVEDERKIFIAIFYDKTTEKLLEQNLIEQQNMAELLSDASVDRVFVTDLNNYVIRWNLRCEEDFHIRREDAVDKNIFDLFPKLKEPQWHSCFQKALVGEQIYLNDQKSFADAGYCNLAMLPLKDDRGNVSAVLTIVHDITREYELWQQLTDRLQFIEKLMEATVDRIVALDKNMNYVYWNKKAEQYYGYFKEEVIGKNILEMFPGFIDDPTYAQFRRALKGETVFIPAKKNLEDRKGYFETYLIPITDEHDEISGVLWIVHDLIAEYHLVNQQRKAGHILESINEAYIETDFDGKLTYVNPRAEKFWNKSREQLLDKSVLDIFSSLQNPSAVNALSRVLNERKDEHGEFHSEVTDRWLYLSCTVTNEGVIVLFYDISDLKTTENRP
jgi:PAS domain S-box-containing protein